MIFLRSDGRLIVLLVEPGPGEEDRQVRGPGDDRVIGEFRPVVEIQSSARDFIENSISMPKNAHRHAGIPR